MANSSRWLPMLMLAASPVIAEDAEWRFFGTLAIGQLDQDSADYVQQIVLQAQGIGATENPSPDTDTLLGLHFDYAFNDSLAATVQAVYHQDVDGKFGPDVSVALLRWNLDANNYLRLGRIQNPQYLLSDTALVTFAKPWIRPRPEVYVQSPFPYLDGFAAHLHPSLFPDGVDIEFGWSWLRDQRFFGGDNARMTGPFLSLSWQQNQMQMKLSYSDFDIKANVPALSDVIDVMQQFDPVLAREFTPDYHWNVLSFSIETLFDPWHVIAELSARDSYGITPDLLAGYLTLEYQWQQHRPYVTVFSLNSSLDIDPTGSPAAPIAEALLSFSDYDQHGFALGYSYYFNDNIAMKLQADYLRTEADSYGLFINHRSDYQVNQAQSFWLYSFSIDFWF